MTVLEAMARQEGFYVEGSRAQRNCNPGNIEFGKFARAHGATKTDGRFAIFPNADIGFACMKALLLSAYSGLTVQEAITKYAPMSENNTEAYVVDVCRWAGIKPDDVMDEHLS